MISIVKRPPPSYRRRCSKLHQDMAMPLDHPTLACTPLRIGNNGCNDIAPATTEIFGVDMEKISLRTSIHTEWFHSGQQPMLAVS